MKKIAIVIGIVLLLVGVFAITYYKKIWTFDIFSTQGRVYNFDIQHDGLTRYYKVYVPNSYDKNKKTPAVLYLHGGGGNKDTAEVDGLSQYADTHGFILVAPEGTGKFALGRLWGTWNGGEYTYKNIVENCCDPAADASVDDVGFISKVIDIVVKDFNVDQKRIYATGISNGGIMTYRLACELSDKIAAIAPVASAGIPDSCNPQKSVSLMYIHGTGDLCAPYEGGLNGKCIGNEQFQVQSAKLMVDHWRKIFQCSNDTKTTYQNGSATCVSYNGCTSGTETTFCTIEGMGHTYPGGSQYFSESKIGPVSHDLTFDQIWEFFTKHSIE